MSRICLLSLVTAIGISAIVPSQAHALAYRLGGTEINSAGVRNDPGLRADEQLVAGFDGNDSLSFDPAHSSGYGLFTGSTVNVAAAPTGDTGRYVAIGAGGSMMFDLRGYTGGGYVLNSVSAYLGSLDIYNFIDVLGLTSDGSIDYGNPLLTVGGAELIGLAGGHPDGRLTFGFDESTRIGAIIFRSTGAAFEFDSIAISQGRAAGPPLTAGAVPEPASWAMMVGGFGVIGGAMRRRQKAAVRFG